MIITYNTQPHFTQSHLDNKFKACFLPIHKVTVLPCSIRVSQSTVTIGPVSRCAECCCQLITA